MTVFLGIIVQLIQQQNYTSHSPSAPSVDQSKENGCHLPPWMTKHWVSLHELSPMWQWKVDLFTKFLYSSLSTSPILDVEFMELADVYLHIGPWIVKVKNLFHWKINGWFNHCEPGLGMPQPIQEYY